MSNKLRHIPLKIAGVIGLLSTAFYLAVAVGQETGVGPAALWLVMMASASLLAWFADEFEGRRAAIVAAGLFFILGIASPPFFAVVFLVAVVLCVLGFVDFRPRADGRPEGDWLVIAYRSGKEMVPPDKSGETLLSIADGRVSGTMGVNRLTGRWEDTSIVAPMATTGMAGPPELMDQERILLDHLQHFDSVEIADDGMTLSRNGLVMVELERQGTAEPDPTS